MSCKDPICFLLTLRPFDDGRTQVLLRLYRSGCLVSETVVSTINDAMARMILLMSRLQMFRLGYDEHVPAMPRATDLQLGSI